MKHDSLGPRGVESENLIKMPRNGLSLAVLITREPHHVGFLRLTLQSRHEFLLLGRNFIYRGKIIGNVDAEILLVKIADMSVARHHLVVITQKFFNGLCLGRRLYYN